MHIISFDNVCRKIIYQNVKRANITSIEELAYNEFDNYEIVTQKHLKTKPTHYNNGNDKEYFATYIWYARAGNKLLEKYDTTIDAIKGHLKWCKKEIPNEIRRFI